MTVIHKWSILTKLQLGRYAEYLVKIELTLHGLDVYTAEVDDKGIDFVVRKDGQNYFDIQVKSSRNLTYVFLQKSKFLPRENLFVALVLFTDGEMPALYLISSTAWRTPNAIFIDRDYEGLKSKPEYGINLSRRNLPLLATYSLENIVENMKPWLIYRITQEIGHAASSVDRHY